MLDNHVSKLANSKFGSEESLDHRSIHSRLTNCNLRFLTYTYSHTHTRTSALWHMKHVNKLMLEHPLVSSFLAKPMASWSLPSSLHNNENTCLCAHNALLTTINYCNKCGWYFFAFTWKIYTLLLRNLLECLLLQCGVDEIALVGPASDLLFVGCWQKI